MGFAWHYGRARAACLPFDRSIDWSKRRGATTHEPSAVDPPGAPQRIGISQARARWYELLRRVKAGETFIITVRGVDKATLKPVPPDHPAMLEWLAKQAEKESNAPAKRSR